MKDEGAIAELYQRYAPAVYARCLRYLGSPAAARDAVQETFVRVLVRGEPLDSGREPLSYLHRVSTNICLNILRDRKVRARAGSVLAQRATASCGDEEGHADRQFASALLERCSERDSAIAVMHYIDRMSHSEIAEILGITRRTVFNRLRRLQALAADLLTGEGKQNE